MSGMERRLWCVVLLAACGADPAPPGVPAAPPPASAGAAVADPGPTPWCALPAGTFAPLFPGRDGRKQIPVAAFRLEEHPVTNAQFAAFVAAEPQWRRSAASPLFADGGYLATWASDLDPGAERLDRPVTGVSWFAARAYARWRGRRLPTLAEWESAAALPLAGGGDAARATLDWYGKPAAREPGPIGSGLATAAGVRDLHGLVWEWVDDFATAMVTGDARGDTDLMRSLFCGAGAVGAARPADYAAFMRYALRSSLQGASTTTSLGFRCAAEAADAAAPCCSGAAPLAAVASAESLYQLGAPFVDHGGATRHLADLAGRPVVMAMIYTRCSFACPAIVADCKRLLAGLSRNDLHVVLVSMDSARDDPATLAAFAREHALPADRFTLLHGDAEAVRELAAVLGVRYAEVEGGNFSHGNQLALLDHDGRIAARLEGLAAEQAPFAAAIAALPRRAPPAR